MANLADYRTDLHNLLATAVDSSTWTEALFDQSLRMALEELNPLLVYETSFTVASAGHEQDLSSISEIQSVLAAAYPWQEGWDFGIHLAAWRRVGHNTIYFTTVSPALGEAIRVRYFKQHMLDDLDSATATTVPDAHRSLVGLWAAAYACDLRRRQISENPALPKDAGQHLAHVAERFRRQAQDAISHVPPLGRLRWATLGLA